MLAAIRSFSSFLIWLSNISANVLRVGLGELPKSTEGLLLAVVAAVACLLLREARNSAKGERSGSLLVSAALVGETPPVVLLSSA